MSVRCGILTQLLLQENEPKKKSLGRKKAGKEQEKSGQEKNRNWSHRPVVLDPALLEEHGYDFVPAPGAWENT